MSYTVLARKWRPTNFESVIGQPTVVQALRNALKTGRLHHAYLFSGTRGVGKTTLARILAMCLNCEAGVSDTPCGQCSSCQEIRANCSVDLIEIDAASRTRVEDTRDLLDNVPYAPHQSRYKIYLIDEVHMLSTHSFNALLKTLEEPPEHVKFLLATTDPQKLPITVLSRCLQFHLKNMSPEAITHHLQTLCEQEQLTAEEPALKQIALSAKGSMRDALSLMDQAIAYSQSNLSLQAIRSMLGQVDANPLIHLLHALHDNDPAAMMAQINVLSEHNADYEEALNRLISLLHQCALQQHVPNHTPDCDGAAIQSLAEQFTPETIQLFYQIALIGRRDLSLAPDPRAGFEMVCLRLLAFQPAEKGPLPSQPPPPTEKTETNPIQTDDWRTLVNHLPLTGLSQTIAQNSQLDKKTDNHYDLLLNPQHAPLFNKEQEKRIAEALSEHCGHPITVRIRVSPSNVSTPAMEEATEFEAAKRVTEDALAGDPKLAQFKERFAAQVIAGTTEPKAEDDRVK